MPSAAQVGTSGGSGSAPASSSAVAQVAAAGGAGGKLKEHAQANKNRNDRVDRYGKVGMPVIGPFSYMVLAFMKGIISIFGHKHIVWTNDRVGLSGSVILLFDFFTS